MKPCLSTLSPKWENSTKKCIFEAVWKIQRHSKENSIEKQSSNRAENQIRPFTVGRKNWLFSDTPAGAKASAMIYSIVETAKANNLAPRDYIQFLFKNLPDMEIQTHPDCLKQMLPWGKLIQENFAWQQEASDSESGASCLSGNVLSPGGYVVSGSLQFQLTTKMR